MSHGQRFLPGCVLLGAVLLLAGCAPYTAPRGFCRLPPPPPGDDVVIICPGPPAPAPAPPPPGQVGGTPDRTRPLDRDMVEKTRPPRTKPETVAVDTRTPRDRKPVDGGGRTPHRRR